MQHRSEQRDVPLIVKDYFLNFRAKVCFVVSRMVFESKIKTERKMNRWFFAGLLLLIGCSKNDNPVTPASMPLAQFSVVVPNKGADVCSPHPPLS